MPRTELRAAPFVRILGNSALVLCSLLLFELMLQLASPWFAPVDMLTRPPWSPRFEIDPRNGFVGDPSHPEHDDWGYRNQRRPAVADIVTIGDSWTYGISLARSDTWPVVLAGLSGGTVYNAGMTGTGMINYLQSFRQIVSMKPKIIIVGLYLGNDLLVTERQLDMEMADLVFDHFPQNLADTIEQAETINPLEPYWNCGRAISNDKQHSSKGASVSYLRAWLSENSRLYGMARSLKDVALSYRRNDATAVDFYEEVGDLTVEQRHACFPFSDGEWRTVFANAWRLRALDLTDARVRTALDVANEVLGIMKFEAMDKDAQLVVVLFPTKESVFFPRVNASNAVDRDVLLEIKTIVTNERLAKDRLITFLTEQNISYIDMLPHLQAADHQPFFGSSDAHPNAFGNLVIARAVQEFLAVRP